MIVATNTHFLQTPACAPIGRRGVGRQGRSRVRSLGGCAGFGYALGVAADMIRGGSATKMLVVGTEKLSPTVDMQDRSNCFIFADGAAASVVGETPVQGIGPTVWGSDGEQALTPYARTSTGSTSWHDPTRPTPVPAARGQRGVPVGGIRDGQASAGRHGRGGRQTRRDRRVRTSPSQQPHQRSAGQEPGVAAGRRRRQRHRAHREHVGRLHSAGDGRTTGNRGGQAGRSGPADRLRRGPELCRAGRADANVAIDVDASSVPSSGGASPRSRARSCSRSRRRRSPATASAAVARRRSGANSQMPRGIAMIRANNTATTIGNWATPISRATP